MECCHDVNAEKIFSLHSISDEIADKYDSRNIYIAQGIKSYSDKNQINKAWTRQI